MLHSKTQSLHLSLLMGSRYYSAQMFMSSVEDQLCIMKGVKFNNNLRIACHPVLYKSSWSINLGEATISETKMDYKRLLDRDEVYAKNFTSGSFWESRINLQTAHTYNLTSQPSP